MRRPINAFDPSILTTALLLFAVFTAILIGVAVLQRARRSFMEPGDEPEDVLASLQEAYFAGELDEAEFQRVRESVARPPEMPAKPDPPPTSP